MNSVIFIVLAFVYMYIGRKIGWVLSRNILYSASAGVTALLCVGWGIAVGSCIHALIALLDPNTIVKVIFGFLLGAYVAIPNYGLVAESSIPPHAMPKHNMIFTLPVLAYVLTLLALAWMHVLVLLLSLALLGVTGVIFIAVFNQQFHFKISSKALYDQVAEELQAKTMVPGLWTKAFAEARGQMDRARALYIKYRVAQLAHEASEQLRQERRAKREAAKQQAATERVKQRGATEGARQRAILSWRNFAYGGLGAMCGVSTLISALLTLAALFGAFGHQTGQVPDDTRLGSIVGVVMAAVFGFLTVLCTFLTWKCFKEVKSVTPPPPPAHDA